MSDTKVRTESETSNNGYTNGYPNGQEASNGAVPTSTSAVVDEALRIVNAAPEPRTEAEVVARLAAVKRLVQAAEVKIPRVERRGLGGRLLLLSLREPGTSEEAMRIRDEIMSLITPERNRSRQLVRADLP